MQKEVTFLLWFQTIMLDTAAAANDDENHLHDPEIILYPACMVSFL